MRLDLKLTQHELAGKSNVAIASVRKFERTGIIALESFLRFALTLGVLDKIITAMQPKLQYDSIDQILAAKKRKIIKRVRKKQENEYEND
jgi:transcriptional regulator with XRE-family HTH domain